MFSVLPQETGDVETDSIPLLCYAMLWYIKVAINTARAVFAIFHAIRQPWHSFMRDTIFLKLQAQTEISRSN
jgi:hypothetical protein